MVKGPAICLRAGGLVYSLVVDVFPDTLEAKGKCGAPSADSTGSFVGLMPDFCSWDLGFSRSPW